MNHLFNQILTLHHKLEIELKKTLKQYQLTKQYFLNLINTNKSNNTLLGGYYVIYNNKIQEDFSEHSEHFETLVSVRTLFEQGIKHNQSPESIIQEAKEKLHVDLDVQDISTYIHNIIKVEPLGTRSRFSDYLENYEQQLTGEASNTTLEYHYNSVDSNSGTNSNNSSRSSSPDILITDSSRCDSAHMLITNSSNTTTPKSDGIPIEYIIIGGVIAVGLVAAAIYYFWWRKRKPPQDGISNTGSSNTVPEKSTKIVSDKINKFSLLNKELITLVLVLGFIKIFLNNYEYYL